MKQDSYVGTRVEMNYTNEVKEGNCVNEYKDVGRLMLWNIS